MDPRGLARRARDSVAVRGAARTAGSRSCSPDSPSPAASALARLAFDSLLQRDGADAARGRAFARYETRFQIVWVIGGLVAVLFFGGGRAGIFLVALVLLFGGLSYIGAVRRRAPGRAHGAAPRAAAKRPGERDPAAKPRVMAFEIRAVTDPTKIDDLIARRTIARSGGRPVPPTSRVRGPTASSTAPGVAFDDGALVGASRAYSFELTMPGGAVVPAAAVSWVGVPPTHRRRGVLNADDRGAPRRRARAR